MPAQRQNHRNERETIIMSSISSCKAQRNIWETGANGAKRAPTERRNA